MKCLQDDVWLGEGQLPGSQSSFPALGYVEHGTRYALAPPSGGHIDIGWHLCLQRSPTHPHPSHPGPLTYKGEPFLSHQAETDSFGWETEWFLLRFNCGSLRCLFLLSETQGLLL